MACRGQYISFAEATAILKNELKFPEERAIHFVKRFDHNKDGRLSAGEFTQFKKRIEDTYVTSVLTSRAAEMRGSVKRNWRPPVRLSVCQSVICQWLKNGAFYSSDYHTTQIGSRMLKVEPAGHRRPMATAGVAVHKAEKFTWSVSRKLLEIEP